MSETPMGRRLRVARAELGHLARLATRVVDRRGRGPELLVQFVTSRCDSHCAHCFDWRRRGPAVEARDLTREELGRIAARLPQPYFVILTGGEPYLRADFAEIVLDFARHARPRVLATPTNGGRPDAILAQVERVLAGLPPEVAFSVNVSLDGVGALHDEIRGRRGLFERASETIRRLQALARAGAPLSVGVVTVVSGRNQDQLEGIMSHVLDELGVPIWAPFLVRGEPRDPAVADVDMARYGAVARALEERIRARRYREYAGFVGARVNSAKNVVRRALIDRTVREGRRLVPCSAGRQAAVVYADGSVFPCELLHEPMGNLRDHGYDLARLWRTAQAEAVRRAVDTAGCACTHENMLTTSIAFAWRQWPALLRWTLEFARSR